MSSNIDEVTVIAEVLNSKNGSFLVEKVFKLINLEVDVFGTVSLKRLFKNPKEIFVHIKVGVVVNEISVKKALRNHL